MAKQLVKVGATSHLATIFIQDSSKSTGVGLGSVAWNTAGITAYYFREGDAASTAITLATMAIGTWATGGLILVDGTNMPGVVQLGLPDLCFAVKGSVVVFLQGVTNMAPVVLEFQVVGFDPTDGVHLGLTAIPNAASGSAGALLVDGTGTAAISNSSGKVLLQATQTGVTIPTVTTVTNDPTAAQIATAVWTDLMASSDFSTASSIGALLKADINAPIGSIPTNPYTGTPPTAAAIATAVWTDTTAGDFTTLTSPGKIIFAQLGGAFTTTSSSVFTVAALANGPSGSGSSPAAIATAVWQDLTSSGDFGTAGSIGALLKADINAPIGSIPTNPYTGTPPTVAQIATAVWQDATAGDFTTASSIGKALFVNAVPGAAGGHFIAGSNATTSVNITGNITGNLASVSSVTGNVGGNVNGNVNGSVSSVTGNVGGNVVGSVASVVGAVGSVTAGVTVTTNNDKTGYALSATGTDLVLAAGKKLTDALRYIGATVAGVITTSQTAVETFQDFAGANAVAITVSATGQRSAITYT